MKRGPFGRLLLLRLLAGLTLLGVLLPLLVSISLPALHRWGASDDELALALPGDQILVAPQLRWTHGITIDAPPATVWPWIAQLGDQRGGFYSFTFIENQIGALTGAADYRVVYHNANAIVAAWQQPRPGDDLISGALKIAGVEPGVWLLGVADDPQALGWTWLWYLAPLDGGTRTRLVVRFAIQPPAGMNSPALGLMMDMGGFVMEQRMLHGLKLRAEGWREPAWSEAAEIGLWLAALVGGLAAAALFVLRPGWQRPLAIAVSAVVVLFVLTFVQPPLWLRLLLDIAVAAGVWWTLQTGQSLKLGRTARPLGPRAPGPLS